MFTPRPLRTLGAEADFGVQASGQLAGERSAHVASERKRERQTSASRDFMDDAAHAESFQRCLTHSFYSAG
jgi:hypothetical protein